MGLSRLEDPVDMNFDHVCSPIRDFFRGRERSLSAILLRLPALALRFERIYRDELLTDWPTFSTETDVFDSLIADSSAFGCAKSMTLSDRRDFDLLCIEDFKSHGSHSKRLNGKWNDISGAFAECYQAYPPLAFRLDMIAKARMKIISWRLILLTDLI